MKRPKDSAPRIVIDTNLVLSALVFSRGRLVPLRQAWQTHRILPLISSNTAAELIRVLAYPKFKLSPAEQQELLGDYLPYCEVVQLPNPPPVTPVCRDEYDVPFLQLAVAGNAQALVTGDQDLLSLTEKFTLPILTADIFLQTLEHELGEK